MNRSTLTMVMAANLMLASSGSVQLHTPDGRLRVDRVDVVPQPHWTRMDRASRRRNPARVANRRRKRARGY